jgi:hypothetical protein
MCTEHKSHLENEKEQDEYQEIMDSYIKSLSFTISSVVYTCETQLLHGLQLTKDSLKDIYDLFSNNKVHPNHQKMTSIEPTQKLSHLVDVESDNGLIRKNVLNNVQNSNISTTSLVIKKTDKHDGIGPRTDNQQPHLNDNEIRNNNNPLEKTNTSISCNHQEDIGKPTVKLRGELTQTITHKWQIEESGTKIDTNNQETVTNYIDQNLNYYWPLDNDHPLNKRLFQQAVNRRKENNRKRSEHKYPAQYVQYQSSKFENRSKEDQLKPKKWKKTHLDQIKIFTDFRKQTYIEYKTKIDNQDYYPTMSQILDKRVPKPPAPPTFTGAGRGGGTSTPFQNVNNPWQTAGSKRLEKKLGDVFELTSEKYLPKHLPLDSIPNNTTQDPTDLMMPIVFKITKPRKSNMEINNSRTVAAILAAMQNVFHDTYLIPQNITILDKNVLNPLGVPAHDSALSKYITYEQDTPERTIMGRIYMRSNNRLTEYKKDLLFCKYLAREHIVMDEVRLMTINSPAVGYFEDLVPEPDNIKMHTIRLRKHLPPKHPRLQLFVKSLFDSKQRSTKIVVFKCDQCDFDVVHELFQKLDEENKIKFFSWKEFTSLPPDLRDTAFKKQLMFNKTYKSVVLSGFKDNDDNVKMIYKIQQTGSIEESEDKRDTLEDIYVTDYLQEWIPAGTGTPLFYHVYEPIEGQRDTMVHIDNYAEASDYAKVCLRELARVMNAPARAMVFEDVKAAEDGLTKSAWQPYTKAAKLIEDRNNMNYYNNKRARTDTGSTNREKRQNRNNNNTPKTAPPKNVWTNNNKPTPSDTTTTTEETMADIKAHVLEQIEKNNKVIRNEIHDANQATNKRITNIDNKLDVHISTVKDQLKDISDECKKTTISVETNVDRLENIFWKMWSRFEDAPEPEVMDYQKTRDEAKLKRTSEQANNNTDASIDLSLSLSHIDDGVTSNMILTQTEETIHDKASVSSQDF